MEFNPFKSWISDDLVELTLADPDHAALQKAHSEEEDEEGEEPIGWPIDDWNSSFVGWIYTTFTALLFIQLSRCCC